MFYFDEETINIISCEVVLIKKKHIFLKRKKKTHSECVLANALPD